MLLSCTSNLLELHMTKLSTLFAAAAFALIGTGTLPVAATTAHAKTATQIKQEERAKQTIARNNAKRAAARSKNRK
jgi:hypothetical protein